jgi:ribonuclease P protein component
VQRLKTRTQFQAVLGGVTVSRTAHFALHRAPLDVQEPKHLDSNLLSPVASISLFTECDVWVGAMVPKRWAKRAVTRNAIKRQIYNVSSELATALPVAAHLVRLRSGFDRARFVSATSDALKAAVRSELHQLFSRATESPRVGSDNAPGATP